jgi:hypothetical protein
MGGYQMQPAELRLLAEELVAEMERLRAQRDELESANNVYAEMAERRRATIAELLGALRLNYSVVNTLECMADHPTLTVVKQIEAAQDAARAAIKKAKEQP